MLRPNKDYILTQDLFISSVHQFVNPIVEINKQKNVFYRKMYITEEKKLFNLSLLLSDIPLYIDEFRIHQFNEIVSNIKNIPQARQNDSINYLNIFRYSSPRISVDVSIELKEMFINNWKNYYKFIFDNFDVSKLTKYKIFLPAGTKINFKSATMRKTVKQNLKFSDIEKIIYPILDSYDCIFYSDLRATSNEFNRIALLHRNNYRKLIDFVLEDEYNYSANITLPGNIFRRRAAYYKNSNINIGIPTEDFINLNSILK